ncbi:MAG: 5-(carboxyamino)imidazole ribonucleotide synthase [Bacteroidota bacterium]
MDQFSSNFTLGILGGGQLGKMLLYETRKWDVRTKVLDASVVAPARMACNEFVLGDLMDFDTVLRFASGVDLLTIEIENVNVAALEHLEKEGLTIYPQPSVLRTIQHKGRQKEFYKAHHIPTAPFTRFNNKTELGEAIANGNLSLPLVWKSAQFGYDGQGVKVIKTQSDLDILPDGECLAEDLVDFKTELAVIVARNADGETKAYPVVEMEFHPEANQVEYVICPARVAPEVAQKAQEIALKVSECFGQVGLLAVELFQTEDNDILVNEVAPRPHNSGHYSIEASYTNQFEQHLRCILGLPLGKTESMVAGVMVNLVGAEGHEGPVTYNNMNVVLAMEGVTPHIYGKAETRPFRKMGHVTIVDTEMSRARALAQVVKEKVKVVSKN